MLGTVRPKCQMIKSLPENAAHDRIAAQIHCPAPAPSPGKETVYNNVVLSVRDRPWPRLPNKLKSYYCADPAGLTVAFVWSSRSDETWRGPASRLRDYITDFGAYRTEEAPQAAPPGSGKLSLGNPSRTDSRPTSLWSVNTCTWIDACWKRTRSCISSSLLYSKKSLKMELYILWIIQGWKFIFSE